VNACSKDVVLPKTPAPARRRRPAPARRSRTLRSTAASTHRDSMDSGVELEMTKKSRGASQLGIVAEKTDDDNQTVTSSTSRDSQPSGRKTESQRKTDENTENVETSVPAVVKQTESDKECGKNQQLAVTQQTSDTAACLSTTTSSQVLMYLSLLYCWLCFEQLCLTVSRYC